MPGQHEYILGPDGELYHAWLKKGEQAEKHKYVARVEVKDGYRYFYTWPEYWGYLKNKTKTAIIDALGGDKKREMIEAQNRMNSAQKGIDRAKDREAYARKNLEDTKEVARLAAGKGHQAALNLFISENKLDEMYKDREYVKSWDKIIPGFQIRRYSDEEIANQERIVSNARLKIERGLNDDYHLRNVTIPRQEEQVIRYIKNRDSAIRNKYKAGLDYVNARDEYLQTPLGKYETASREFKQKTNQAKDWFEELFSKRRNR